LTVGILSGQMYLQSEVLTVGRLYVSNILTVEHFDS